MLVIIAWISIGIAVGMLFGAMKQQEPVGWVFWLCLFVANCIGIITIATA